MKSNKGSIFLNATLLLRLEAMTWFFLSVYLFLYLKASWWMFTAIFFVPDISMIGYVISPRKGAMFYNAMHSQLVPFIFAGVGLLFTFPILYQVALIWICHISFNRMIGVGLKYSDSFTHTHLGEVSFRSKFRK